MLFGSLSTTIVQEIRNRATANVKKAMVHGLWGSESGEESIVLCAGL